VSNPSNAQLSGVDDDNIAAGALSSNRIAGTAEVLSNKGAASGYAALNGSTLVVQNPANAQITPGASKLVQADGVGKIDDGWLSSNVSLLGTSISLGSEVAGTLPLANGGTNASSLTASRCVRVNDAGTALEAAGADCGAGGGGAPTDAQYIVVALNGTLSAERRLQGTANRVTLTDSGANGDFTLDIGSDVATGNSSHTFTNKTLDVEATGNSITTVSESYLEAAACNGPTASLMWDTQGSGAPSAACFGSNANKGVADFDAASDEQMHRYLLLPDDFTGAVDISLVWFATAVSGSVRWEVNLDCAASGEDHDPSVSNSTTFAGTPNGTTNRLVVTTQTGVTITGCAANELARLRVKRDGDGTSGTDDMAGDARLVGARIKSRRAQ